MVNRSRSSVLLAALATGVVLANVLAGAGAKPVSPPQTGANRKLIDFNRDVRPILSEHCFKCHGPAAKDVKGNLRLDERASAVRDRGGYKVIVPGKPSQSMLWTRVKGDVPELIMPPVHGGVRPLSPHQKETLRRWIEEGAEYKPHWAFSPVEAPAPPIVKQRGWVKDPIDAFVLARLEKARLLPEPEADRRTLIRRVALTLTGLQPTPAEIDAFLGDLAPGAYERMVDRYLASPRYGEHQARFWLDAVRYGDTHGLHLDNERSIYPYRDWVVRAFNDDLSFRDFATWQLAGDLLPSPTTEQRIATGYIRMNPTTNEGGAIEDEFLAKNTFDRVDTFGTVFLGLTVACARCHDHKYDPIRARDYYGLYAFFNSTADKPLDGNELTPAPVMRAPTPDQEHQLRTWRQELTRLEMRVEPSQAETWLRGAYVEPLGYGKWEVSGPFSGTNFDEAFVKEFGPEPGGVADPGGWRELKLELGKPYAQVVGKENSAAYIRSAVTTARPREVTLRLSSDDALKVWVNGALVHDNKVLRGVNGSVDVVKVRFHAGANELVFKVVNAGGPDGFVASFDDELEQRISRATRDLDAKVPGASVALAKLFLQVGPESELSTAYRAIEAKIAALEASIPMTLVAEELPKPRPAFILRRGEYNLPTEKVERSIPAALGTWPKGAPKNRLGLAMWLVDGRNPLTARVFVNRVWQQHFGQGLVRTVEDFGAQGEWPSHPELLDALAASFVREGWSVKKLHRRILVSAAFRQRAGSDGAKRTRDPENRLVSRGPRFRLDAEVIRDQALFASGLLVEQMGGKGVKPYQPPGLWEAIGFLESTTSRYVQDKGDALYRRSLYLFWKRTSPPPAMLMFDAPMREACTVRRSRSNTPTQALVTLNDPAFLEAARFLAERVCANRASDAGALRQAFRLTLGREPTEKERELLLASLERYRRRFGSDKQAALALLQVGERPRNEAIDPAEHAAWTLIANTLMNLDEFLTQH